MTTRLEQLIKNYIGMGYSENEAAELATEVILSDKADVWALFEIVREMGRKAR